MCILQKKAWPNNISACVIDLFCYSEIMSCYAHHNEMVLLSRWHKKESSKPDHSQPPCEWFGVLMLCLRFRAGNTEILSDHRRLLPSVRRMGQNSRECLFSSVWLSPLIFSLVLLVLQNIHFFLKIPVGLHSERGAPARRLCYTAYCVIVHIKMTDIAITTSITLRNLLWGIFGFCRR